MKKILPTLIRIVLITLAAAFLYSSIQKYGGFAAIAVHLKKLGFFALAVVANSLGWMALYTMAWRELFIGSEKNIAFFHLLRVKICGESVNLATPAGFVGGDPVRVLLLKGSLGATDRLRSVVVDRLLHIFATFVFCSFGTALVFFPDVVLPRWLATMGVAGVVFYSLMSLLVLFVLLRLLQGKGLGIVGKILEITGVMKKFPSFRNFFDTLQADLIPYAHQKRGVLLRSFAGHFMGRILGALENAIIIYAMLGTFDVVLAIILATFTSFFLLVFGFIPGGIGVIEEMYAIFFAAFGADPAVGFAVQVVRRLRAVFWVIIGFFMIDIRELLRVWSQSRKKKEVIEH